MGKAARLACIFVPMALTLASLICIILVGLGGTNKSSSTLNSLYFFKADTSNVTINTNLLNGTKVDDNLLNKGVDALKKDLNLKGFYTVSLWNYCDGTGDKVEYCSPRTSQFWFNPVEVWGLNNTGAENAFPKELRTGLNAYRTVSKWMFTAYIVAFVATLVEFLIGFAAIFSRWGSLVTTVVSVVSSLFMLAASITATALYAALAGNFNSWLKPYGIHGSLGKSMYTTTWLATAFSLGAGIFWLFSVCCVSGRSDNKRVKVEKTPYTYERMPSPAFGEPSHSNRGVPMQNMGKSGTAYEPFRHEHV
ncbi:MAG: hypothetical protein M1836_003733 [Candelina mexicana]|nr:MAG: hypothetical protein M1836_003733 [Candelina mexicana]